MNREEKLKEKCTGCFACLSTCPRKAIIVNQNASGFYVPQINIEECLDCGSCERICPQLNTVKTNTVKKVYAATAIDNKVSIQCSSGGVFGVFASYFIKQGGSVAGCRLSDGLIAEQCIVNNKKDLAMLYGSKYVQSKSDDLISSVVMKIKKKKLVLVCGTPCQIAGLKKVVGDPENLLTIDIICHGVTSPKLFEMHKDLYEKRNNCTIENIYFRDKEKNNWGVFCAKYVTNRGKHYIRATADPYYATFLGGKAYSSVCYECKYAQKDRVADLTIGDCWGAENICKEMYDLYHMNGISSILINTTKGQEFFERISNQLNIDEVEFEELCKYNRNLCKPSRKPYEYFYNLHFCDDNIKRYDLKMRKQVTAMEKIKNILPSKMLEVIKKYIR